VTIYERLLEAGIPLDSHESDLYALVTPESTRIVAGYEHAKNVRTFRSEVDGRQWFDIPFAYLPWWQRRTR